MTQRPISATDLFQFKFLQAAELSPDERWICGIVSEYSEKEDADIYHLWLYPLDGGLPRQLTHGYCINSQPTWSPDGSQIAFLSDRRTGINASSNTGTKSQIYLLPIDGGEARLLTALPQGAAGPLAWSPTGEWIAFGANRLRQTEWDPTEPYRITRQVYRFDVMGYLDQHVQDLYLVSVTTGEVKQITDDMYHNTYPRWSPNGKQILYSVQMASDTPCAFYAGLRIVDLSDIDTSDSNSDEIKPEHLVTIVVDDKWGDLMGSASWLPDGKRIVFVGTPRGLPIGTKEDLYVTDSSGSSTPICRSSNAPIGVGGRLQADMPTSLLHLPPRLLISTDSRYVYTRIQDGGSLRLARVALEGPESVEFISASAYSYIPIGMAKEGSRLICGKSTMHMPLELVIVDIPKESLSDTLPESKSNFAEKVERRAEPGLAIDTSAGDATGGQEYRLSHLNAQLLTELEVPTVRHLQFRSKDDVAVEGWLLYPNRGKAPYPTILYIHGGPHSGFGHVYHFDTQMLVGAGYAVLLVNHRASTGYGDSFSTAIKGDWGNLDYADLMAGVDAAIDSGITDPDRLGVCGLSGGGNLSCWIVGQTNRFKAAVPENPLTNWHSFYGVSDIGVWFGVEQLGGHPHEIPDVYSRCSPITYAHTCTTPTLLVQCESDWRCPAEQSEQFYNVLKANSCVVEMLRIPGGSHGSCIVGPPKMRRAQNEALLEWMNRYV